MNPLDKIRAQVNLIVQVALHILVALTLLHGMEGGISRWEFWVVMLALPVIRAVDEWNNP